LRYSFEDCVLDTDCRELRRGTALMAVEPQVFDLLVHLIRHRDRVVSKDDLLAAVWQGRIVSESALFNRINAARTAIGDAGDQQRLIKTLPRKASVSSAKSARRIWSRLKSRRRIAPHHPPPRHKASTHPWPCPTAPLSRCCRSPT